MTALATFQRALRRIERRLMPFNKNLARDIRELRLDPSYAFEADWSAVARDMRANVKQWRARSIRRYDRRLAYLHERVADAVGRYIAGRGGQS